MNSQQLHGPVVALLLLAPVPRQPEQRVHDSPCVCWASAPTRTFSSAVMLPKSRMFWNVRAMPSLVIW